ncbi:hypothetical protein [Amycolatopsis sp. NBC_01480]|uniref:hypothetical protein n=1 Tax=Amycolatopsis sp. NBC_01480 TaxID=2903562 RepID=UPI002E2A8EB9|nr:hypothetical protein [Amycolatopsis sp. NBC_01480]
MAAGLAQPTGSDDTGLYTGVILTWDESSGVNTVNINGVPMSNLRVIQSGIGLVYQPNDTVIVQRKGTQYFIMGKVAAPGAGASGQIQSQDLTANEDTTSTSFVDLPTFGPSVTVYVGSSRRVLVLVSATFTSLAWNASAYTGGRSGVQVSGASSIAPSRTISGLALNTGIQATGSRAMMFTATDGLNVGSNTFTMKYRAETADGVRIGARNLTVIPF